MKVHFPLVAVAVTVLALFIYHRTQEDLMSLSTIRARHDAHSLEGKVAVVVGGTAGLGAGVALRLARSDASVVIVGRSKQRGDEMVARMSALSKTAKHSFFPCDATLLSNVSQFSSAFSKLHPRLDILVLTQGIATIQGRTETVEGLDVKLSLHYYSRMAFIAKLLPLMTGDDPRGKSSPSLSPSPLPSSLSLAHIYFPRLFPFTSTSILMKPPLTHLYYPRLLHFKLI